MQYIKNFLYNQNSEKEQIKSNNNFDENLNKVLIDIKEENYLNNLSNNKIGLENSGGSCYMASIIQILIHLEKFLKEFFKPRSIVKNSLTYIFYKFINQIANSSFGSVKIKNFAKEYNKINYKFNGKEGNNPMTFFNEFIKKLGEENNGNIVNLFTGKKNIIFIGMSDCDYEEEFIFHLIYLDENNISIKKALYQEKAFEDDENIKLKEEIIVKPEIFVINLEIEEIEYNFEEEINVYGANYQLKAINRYNDFHSTA